MRVRMMYRQDKTRLCALTLMWMSVEVVSGVRIVQCHAIMDVVIDVRVMQCHAILMLSLASASCFVTKP